MIKLTDERIIGFVDTHVGGPTPSYPLDGSDWINFARAIEAEVLRLNGITEMTPEQKHAFMQDMIADMSGEIEG